MQVKYFHSEQTGAPVLSGVAGYLTDLLDALLVDGWGSKSVTSLVVDGGVARAAFSGTHPAEKGQTITVSGATPSGLNGEQVVTAIGSGYVEFETGLGDQTATGTITFKFAPLGWTKAFTDTNKRAYKSSNPASSGSLLRVNDTGTTTARVIGYESMSTVDAGVGPFPSEGQRSGGLYWTKSGSADSAVRKWVLVGDDLGFYLVIMAGFDPSGVVHYFGDILPYRSGDAFCGCLTGFQTTLVGTNSAVGCVGYGYSDNISFSDEVWMPRTFNGLGGSIQAKKIAPFNYNAAYSGSSGYFDNGMAFPNLADNGLIVSPVMIMQYAVRTIRGKLPGVYHTPQIAVESFNTRDKIDGTIDLPNRTLMAITLNGPANAVKAGVMFMDITGPWR